ncbi:endonuclease/exonuclease/phosphatase family protein [Terrimonas sp. NA20]|uniref:Endonuclease/exonuclease/phosphatase family protein n=1 Tax=Terrimonas ginsenosidimutans TaxID=2908004 RepID=A0ABS9KR95_9BACT|nr:endonuclease/exonuclease/phosphatase family protein [Terrimonas ginsenosidimutans]MCG2614853.1 endonuclease/exonuclease/phosphatase family protein [Terrimonas ginsenosidimutans]
MSASRRNFLKGLGAAALLPALPGFGKELVADHATAGSHRILSCNIRVALDEDEAKGLGWSSRKDICLKVIKNHKPDVICLQEVLKIQADDCRKFFSSYQLIGFDGPEMDAHTTGYHGIAKNPILFSKDRYELLTAGTYWLSETPLVAGSKSWDTARARHANWVRIREKKTGKEFRVVNLHLDHISAEAKIQQAKMVVDESAQYLPDYTQILTGDFNSRFDSNVFSSVRDGGWNESYETIHGKKEAGHTGHEFQGVKYDKASSKGRIDYIWYRGKVKPVGALIIKDDVSGKYPSDHFFLQADLVIE